MALIDELKEIIRCLSDEKCKDKNERGYTVYCDSLFNCLKIATELRKGNILVYDTGEGNYVYRKPTADNIYFRKLQLGEGWCKKHLLPYCSNPKRGVKKT